jgi:hypothetical protein
MENKFGHSGNTDGLVSRKRFSGELISINGHSGYDQRDTASRVMWMLIFEA